jgi:hypothetical protein
MAPILVKMPIFLPGMIRVVPSSEFGQEGPWVFGQWMECQSIYDCGYKLRKLVSQLSIDNPLQRTQITKAATAPAISRREEECILDERRDRGIQTSIFEEGGCEGGVNIP